MSRLLPGTTGLPYVGESFAIFGDPIRYGKAHHQRYGPLFQTRFLGRHMAVFLSAEGHRYILHENARNFLWHPGYGMIGDKLFGDALFLLDDAPHDFQRKLMTPAFHGKELPGYLEHMNQVIDIHLATWGAKGERPFYADARAVAFALSTSLLVGMDPSIDRQRLQRLFTQLLAGAASFTHTSLPWTLYGRSLRARRELTPVLLNIIEERRQHGATDALGRLIAARDEEGNALTDEQLMAQAITLIFAGYDSTSGTLTWLLLELLRHPDLLERIRTEIGDADPDAPVTIEDLRHKPLLDALIKETLRIHPAAAVLMRGTRESCTFEGYEIPAGWTVLMLPSYTHLRPDYFSEPERFDPDRFMAPRDEDARHPYAWIGFGGGLRSCIGSGIAQTEIKTMVTKLLRRFDLRLVSGQDFAARYVPINRPKSDVRIVYQLR